MNNPEDAIFDAVLGVRPDARETVMDWLDAGIDALPHGAKVWCATWDGVRDGRPVRVFAWGRTAGPRHVLIAPRVV